ncbi:MAG: diaminopimelate epimerase [Phycisphaerae bacterium]
MRFTKMQGIGNDYVYVNCFEEKIDDPAAVARKVSDRHFGIGSDGLILVCPSKKANVRMRMFNADGSEAEMCGNGIRCLAKYAYEHKLAEAGPQFTVPGGKTYPASIKVETGSGILTLGLALNAKGKVESVCVNMGQPRLKPKEIPVNIKGDSVINYPLEVLNQRLDITCVSMGNPHTVIFCHDITAVNLERIGPVIENHELFPLRTNVHFALANSRTELTMRTWERGSGITLACGTGACAVCVAGVLTGQSDRDCTIHLPGGDLDLNWSDSDSCVYMTGPAEEVFNGNYEL